MHVPKCFQSLNNTIPWCNIAIEKWVFWLPTTFNLSTSHCMLKKMLSLLGLWRWLNFYLYFYFFSICHVKVTHYRLQRSQVINSSCMVTGLSHHRQLIISCCFFNNISDFKIRFCLFVCFFFWYLSVGKVLWQRLKL